MDPQVESSNDAQESATQLHSVYTTNKFWMVFNCPELHGLIFDDMSTPELRTLMLVNQTFANTLRPLVWKTLELYDEHRRKSAIPADNIIIQNASLIRSLSTNCTGNVRSLVASGACTRLRSLKFNQEFCDPTAAETDRYFWKLVRINPRLELLQYFPYSYKAIILFAAEPRLSLMNLPEQCSDQEMTSFRRTSLVEISLKRIEFGQDHLKELVELCPNLTALEIGNCTYTAGTDPFGGNQLSGPQKLTSLKFTPLKSSKDVSGRALGYVSIRFQSPWSNVELLELVNCDDGILKEFQRCLISEMTSLQPLLMVDSNKVSEVERDEIIKDILNAAAPLPCLREIHWSGIQLGPQSMNSLVCGLHVQTLTALQLVNCKGVQSRDVQQILVHCTKLKEIRVDGRTCVFNVAQCKESDWGCKDLTDIELHLVISPVEGDPDMLVQCSSINPMLQQLQRLLSLECIRFEFEEENFSYYAGKLLTSLELLKGCTNIRVLSIGGVPSKEVYAIEEWCETTWPEAEVYIDGDIDPDEEMSEDYMDESDYEDHGIFEYCSSADDYSSEDDFNMHMYLNGN